MTKNSLKILLAQLDPLVGDVAGNADKARAALAIAKEQGADLVVFPELFLAGYPPEDLVLKPAFQAACRKEAEKLGRATEKDGPALLIGSPWAEDGKLFNSVLLMQDGGISHIRHKVHLPNYGVFDEVRVFSPGPMPDPAAFRGMKLGVPICEDMWFADVSEHLARKGADILIVPNGSPFTRQKRNMREAHMSARVKETGLPAVYVNQVGGQDELVFDGASFIRHPDGSSPFLLPLWEETHAITSWKRSKDGWICQPGGEAVTETELDGIWHACVTGLRDYVEKNRFPGVVLGLSGGIDSALCAAIAVDALGPDRVHCIMLPYKYTSSESLDDAKNCADALKTRYDILPIQSAVEGFAELLEPQFRGQPPGVAEENIQSRVRGAALMALSNKFGDMVVTTGNKSEMSVGYATLYGDMNGGFNPIKDIYKTEVYKLAERRNHTRPDGCLGPEGIVIPENIITKAPSAELREDQTDQDSLPPYDALDDILHGFVEEELSVADITARGHDRALVKRIEHMLYIAEYKRRQAPPGVRISIRNFGRGRRYPITNGFREGK